MVLAFLFLAASVMGLLRLGGIRLFGHATELPPARISYEPAYRPLVFTYPSPQTRLLETNSLAVYMPTATGRIESAWFGSTRTASSGLAQFHEGVDIAPTTRDPRGWALDDVFAAADGDVVFANNVAGDSNYGKYVVIRHACRTDAFYTLYAHLRDISVREGQAVSAGAVIGRMGNTSNSPIPIQQSHVHFEITVMLNPSFPGWYQAHKLKPDHGAYHGWNLLSLQPLLPYLAQAEGRSFDFRDVLARHPAAFQVIIRSPRLPGYFRALPSAWNGAPYAGPAWTADVSDNGVILRARNSTAEELSKLGGNKTGILSVDTQILGRNGRRLVVPAGKGDWRLGAAGQKWMDMLLYPM